MIRLAKVAIKNDGDYKVMCSFNVEALALKLVTETGPMAAALAAFLLDAAAEIAIELTDDPAGVSGPIKLPDGISQDYAARRLRQLGQIVASSVDAQSEPEARRVLEDVFGPRIADARTSPLGRARLRRGRSAIPLQCSRPRTGLGDPTVSRRRQPSFNDDLHRRLQFEREARRGGLPFTSRITRSPRRRIYRVPIVVPVYDEARQLEITSARRAPQCPTSGQNRRSGMPAAPLRRQQPVHVVVQGPRPGTVDPDDVASMRSSATPPTTPTARHAASVDIRGQSPKRPDITRKAAQHAAS